MLAGNALRLVSFNLSPACVRSRFPTNVSQGKYSEAKRLVERSLAIDEKVYGPDHPEVSADLTNLAAVLATQVRDNTDNARVHPAVRDPPWTKPRKH